MKITGIREIAAPSLTPGAGTVAVVTIYSVSAASCGLPTASVASHKNKKTKYFQLKALLHRRLPATQPAPDRRPGSSGKTARSVKTDSDRKGLLIKPKKQHGGGRPLKENKRMFRFSGSLRSRDNTQYPAETEKTAH